MLKIAQRYNIDDIVTMDEEQLLQIHDLFIFVPLRYQISTGTIVIDEGGDIDEEVAKALEGNGLLLKEGKFQKYFQNVPISNYIDIYRELMVYDQSNFNQFEMRFQGKDITHDDIADLGAASWNAYSLTFDCKNMSCVLNKMNEISWIPKFSNVSWDRLGNTWIENNTLIFPFI